MSPKSLMNLPPTQRERRLRKRRAPQRKQSDKAPSRPPRRSSRLRLKCRSPLEQRLTDHNTSSHKQGSLKQRFDGSFKPKRSPKRARSTAGQAAQVWQRSPDQQTDQKTSYTQVSQVEPPLSPPDQLPSSPPFERYCPEAVDTFVTQWVESESYRERHCQSDSLLDHLDGGLISRRLIQSAPNMEYTRDVGRFFVPPIPASTGSCSRQADIEDDHSRCSASSATGVHNPLYRQTSLRFNKIKVRHPGSLLPDYISDHVHAVQAERNSPGLSSDQLNQDMYRLGKLAEGCTEDQVGAFLNDTIFPNPESDSVYGPTTGLASSAGALMSRHLVPTNRTSPYRVTQPKPDLLYGYSGKMTGPFTQPQLLAQTMLHPRNPDYPTATLQSMRFPFFAIEFKAAGGTRGDLWVATNQCAGASSACVNAVERLNLLLREHKSIQLVDNVTYSVAIDNNTAQLYISWKEDDLNYFIQRVGAFLLSNPDHFMDFRKQVRNILDWGKDMRLKQIGDALDIILEESRKKAAEYAKARPHPSETSRGRGRSRGRGSSSADDSVSSSAIERRRGN